MEKPFLTLDTEKYSHYLYNAIEKAYQYCKEARKEFITPECVLYFLVQQKPFVKAAYDAKIQMPYLVKTLRKYIERQDVVPVGADYILMPSHNLIESMKRMEDMIDGFDDSFLAVEDFVDTVYFMEESYAGSVLSDALEGETIDNLLEALGKHYDADCEEKAVEPGMFDEGDYDYYERKQKKGKEVRKIMEAGLAAMGGAALPFPPLDKDGNPAKLSGISITLGLAGNMLEQLAQSQMGAQAQSAEDDREDDVEATAGASRSAAREPWEDMVTCLNDTFAKKNRLIGRTAELDRAIEVLCRRDKNNPVFIGEPGVGKTALIYGLAKRLVEGDVPPSLEGKRIYSIDMGNMIAGASYHGEFERRMKTILEGMQRRGNCIAYIDEIHTITTTGASNGGGMDAADLLKPYLEDGRIRFIGCTTYQDFNRSMSKNKSIVRRFQQIDVLEPSIDETVEIINALLVNYEVHHRVKYDQDVVRHAVEQSARLIADRFLPDKAIDIIDEAGAYRQAHPLRNKNGQIMTPGRQKVTKQLVDDVLAKVCKINAKALTQNDNTALKGLGERISEKIYGQGEAIDAVVRAVKMSKAGLTFGEKPLASLLFVGPTGVGKTEVCKVLAQELGIELVRFDMSEYTEKHTVAKLIGSPAGYVGYDDGGLLTDAIRKTPNCVLLLDEIEKAHADIYNILLQVMDYAKLTDNKGNKVDFKNVILIMTSNAGAQYAGQASVGFGNTTTKGDAMLQTVKKTFKPEFINRLSGTVVFRDMDETMAGLILDKKLRELASLLEAKHVTLEVSADARKHLLEKGYTKQYGAREMDRVVQNLLTPLLMDEILFGRLTKGGEAVVELRDGTLVLS